MNEYGWEKKNEALFKYVGYKLGPTRIRTEVIRFRV